MYLLAVAAFLFLFTPELASTTSTTGSLIPCITHPATPVPISTVSPELSSGSFPNITTSIPPLISIPFTNLSSFITVTVTPPLNQTTTIWKTVPIASLTGDPFCVNQASPHQGVGNHCVCSNGATLSIIPWSKGGNVSDYQPCAYTTVDPSTVGGNMSTTQ
ncbi:hypothetical protein QBC42DRAFT_279733 [Cladorrhinum samala]|uniref:Uncharacterized protein n=1 Tax=Cladorrhinum samala TaxID=585594 RepID=A0AAV9HBA4_9PEZI|nr:hypothetical protein QBC42DRAFT_279733 [Cladorrhinum samala]